MKKNIQVRRGSPIHQHAISIIERFGHNARLRHDGAYWFIRGAKLDGEVILLEVESVL